MASLRELQRSFAAALRDPDAGLRRCGPRPNLAIYRNNAAINFRAALELELSRCCAGASATTISASSRITTANVFRPAAATCTGSGATFPGSSPTHLAGGDYAWLADLARLEWAREERGHRDRRGRRRRPRSLAHVAPDAAGARCVHAPAFAAAARIAVSRSSASGWRIRPRMPRPWINRRVQSAVWSARGRWRRSRPPGARRLLLSICAGHRPHAGRGHGPRRPRWTAPRAGPGLSLRLGIGTRRDPGS